MSLFYDVIIVGAGPGGLYAACHLSPQLSVLILEKNDQPGRKLLLSGSGQCNFTNHRPIEEFLTCYGDHGRFIKPALYNHTNQDVIQFFKKLGIQSETVQTNGKVFPKSRKAIDLLNGLVSELNKNQVELQCHQPVESISRKENEFTVNTRNHTFICRHLIIATGGCSFPRTGSTGDGYHFASALGHQITTPKPGLTPFDIANFPFTDLAGTSFDTIPVSLYHQSRKLKTLAGPMVITHTGLSGPVIHHLSRYAEKGDNLQLHLMGSTNEQYLRQKWARNLAELKARPITQLIKTIPISKAMASTIFDITGINKLSKIAELGKKQLNRLFLSLFGFELQISSLGGFETAMATVGGIELKEVNSKTMASKLHHNLYFIGELLDIDGDTGGYDLQACWSTGYLAAQEINKSLK